jgi:endonuclease YncB( thermonuclease family)
MAAAYAETVTGRVVGVADGDTITVLDADKVQHKIRLAGIDAPEKKAGVWQPFQRVTV